jgi:hypothetical protein
MRDMFKYSLIELLYWWTFSMICGPALVAVLPSQLAVVVTLWLIGTVVINKGFGRRAGLGYSVIFGFDFHWIAVALTNDLWMGPEPTSTWLIIAWSIRWGFINGCLIWAVATVADYLFKGLIADHARTS